jgi:L-lactate dehydrogenase complex protein LldE
LQPECSYNIGYPLMETQLKQGPTQDPRFQVALFVTCLADLFRPSVAFDSIALLEAAGCEVTVPSQQTCCGQPSYNSGDYQAACTTAQLMIETFEFADYVVAPSASCAAMISVHYPKLLENEWHDRALGLAAKTFELTAFLTQVATLTAPDNRQTALTGVAYHDGCAGLRELGIKSQPRELLKEICQVEVSEIPQNEECCGFGGTFCARMPELSTQMVSDKLDAVMATGADILTGGDLGCLMNIAGRARRAGRQIEVRHIAELLAGNRSGPAIGEGEV